MASNNQYTDSNKIIDVLQNKPYELIHQRFFNNVSASKGWKESVDGLFNYSLDIKLEVGDGGDITLAYSPEVIIPPNVDKTCQPHNFPAAKTVETNTIRLYAYQRPDPLNMLPITINLRAVNTNHGTTNGGYSSSGSDIQIKENQIQVRGTSFIVDIDDDDKLREETEIEMFISGFKGEEKQAVDIADAITPEDIESFNSQEIFKNMDGTKIDLTENKISIRTLKKSAEDGLSAVFWATLPKGLLIKDKLAYFVIPVTLNGQNFWARATVYTNKSDEVVTEVSSYDVSFPVISRSTGGNYFINGNPFDPIAPPEIKINKISVNGVVSNADGWLAVYGVNRNDPSKLSPQPLFSSYSARPKIADPSVFNGWSDLKIEFSVSGVVQYETYTGIDITEQDLLIRTDTEYIIPITSGSKHIVPAFSASVYNIIIEDQLEQYYGDIIVTSSSGEEVISTSKPHYKVSIPQQEYTEGALPTYYLINVLDPITNQSRGSKVVSILKMGDAATPYSLELSPPSMVVGVDKNGIMIEDSYEFSATIMKGSNIVEGWDYEVSYNSQENNLTLQKNPISIGSSFSVIGFSGEAISAIISVTATKEGNSLTRDMVITKIRDVSDIGSYTFIKYGNLIPVENGPDRFEFTVDPSGALEPGEVEGPYYGIAVSREPTAPVNEESYKWVMTGQNQPAKGEQGEPGTSFFIDGINIIKAFPSSSGSVNLSPKKINLEIKSIRGDEAVAVEWQYMDIVDGAWKPFAEDINGKETLVTEITSKMFVVDQTLQIRASVSSFKGDEIVSVYAYLSLYLLHTSSSAYFAQILSMNSDSRYSHVFPVDGYGNAVSGVSYLDNPLVITVQALKGLEELTYKGSLSDSDTSTGFYFLENIKTSNCSVSTSMSNGKLIGHFDEIKGESGSVTFSVSMEKEETIDLTFNWGTDQIANIGDRRIAVTPNRSNFTINSATYPHIMNWSEFSDLYTENFIDENSPLKIFFSSKNTNIKSVSIGNEGIGYVSVDGTIKYGNGDQEKLVPLNLFDENYISLQDAQSDLEAEVVPGEYYLAFTDTKINEWRFDFKNAARGTQKTFTVSEGFVFDGNKEATIIKAPAGSENLTATRDATGASKITSFHLQVSPSLKRILNDDFTDVMGGALTVLTEEDKVISNYHLSLANLKLALGVVDYKLVLPLSYQKTGDVFSYLYDPVNKIEYLELNPRMAVDPNYFDGETADAESQIKVSTITGEDTYLTIYRYARPYADIGNFSDKLEEISSGTYIYRQDLLPLKQSRESVRLTRDEIKKTVEENQITFIESEAPEPGHHEMFYPELEPGITPINNKGTQMDEVVFEGVNSKSIFGVNMYDYSHHLLEFEVKYVPKEPSTYGIVASYSFENMSLKDRGTSSKFTDSKSLTPNEWVKHSYLIPAVRTKDDNRPALNIQDLTEYFEEYEIDTTSMSLVFGGRVENKNQYAAYYMYFDSSSLEGDTILIRSVSLKELQPSLEQENKTYKTIKGLPEYKDLTIKTNAYIAIIDRLESSFTESVEKIPVSDFSTIYDDFIAAQKAIKEIEYQISVLTHNGYENASFKIRSDSRSYALGFSTSAGWLSSLRITPNGVVIQGEKNQIIGSTSIGALYGKKIVIGKEMTSEDMAYDKEYMKDTKGSKGYFAVYDENKWASVINKNGQYFYRYDERDGALGLVGYMVMNPQEIAAYQFDAINKGYNNTEPLDVENSAIVKNKYAAFRIDRTGEVLINKLSVKKTGASARASIDLMDSVRVTDYESEELGLSRKGIVFIGIQGGKK